MEPGRHQRQLRCLQERIVLPCADIRLAPNRHAFAAAAVKAAQHPPSASSYGTITRLRKPCSPDRG